MIGGLFESQALLFTIPALAGTGVFVLRLALMALGSLGGDADVHADAHADVADHHGDSTDAFKLLSVQSVAAFLMGFGWGGVAGLLALDWPLTRSVLLGIGFGVALVWLLGILMKAVYDLAASGNVRIQDAVGAEGAVYVNVPGRGAGRGQVRVVIRERARIYNAVSEGEPIARGSRIRVMRVNDDHTLTVTSV